MEGIIYFRQHSTVCFSNAGGQRNFSGSVERSGEKISDALYIQLKDILAIPVEIDTQHFAQQS